MKSCCTEALQPQSGTTHVAVSVICTRLPWVEKVVPDHQTSFFCFDHLSQAEEHAQVVEMARCFFYTLRWWYKGVVSERNDEWGAVGLRVMWIVRWVVLQMWPSGVALRTDYFFQLA